MTPTLFKTSLETLRRDILISVRAKLPKQGRCSLDIALKSGTRLKSVDFEGWVQLLERGIERGTFLMELPTDDLLQLHDSLGARVV